MHWERTLLQDQANSEREGYITGVGSAKTDSAQEVWVEVRSPYSRDSPLVALAFR